MAITATHVLVGIGVEGALGGAVLLNLVSARPLLRDAERHGHLEHVSTAIRGPHFASARVDASVRATGRAGYSPARLSASSGGLAVLSTGAHLRKNSKKLYSGQLHSRTADVPRPVHRSAVSSGMLSYRHFRRMHRRARPGAHCKEGEKTIITFAIFASLLSGGAASYLLQSTGHDSRMAVMLPQDPIWASVTALVPTRHA